jgi:hypothetical protein
MSSGIVYPAVALVALTAAVWVRHFCRQCEIHPFIRPRLDPSRWAFSVRCIDGIDLSSLKVRPFDGQNWEASARKYCDRVKRTPAA